MPKRKVVFANNEYYHIYNRSTGAIPIFNSNKILNRVLSLIDYYRYPQKLRYSKYKTLTKDVKNEYEYNFRKTAPMLEIYSFAIMPNHYHFLLRQNTDDGVIRYISNLQNSFAKYFNLRNKRFGSVFQGPFKAKRIEKDNYLLHLSRYIHLNPVTSFLIKIEELDNYSWTSFSYYLNREKDKNHLINSSFIIKMVGSREKYKGFVYNQADYQKKLGKIKGLILEK